MLGRRLVLLVGLLALFACVVTTEKQAEAADPALLVEGEDFDEPTGTRVVNDTLYSGGQALKFIEQHGDSHRNCEPR